MDEAMTLEVTVKGIGLRKCQTLRLNVDRQLPCSSELPPLASEGPGLHLQLLNWI